MDEEIRNENKVPGSCEQFTKPEEISALGKYLRKLRTTYEENTSLEKDKIGVIGFNGQLKNEVPLSERVEKIESNENVELSNSIIEVGGGEKIVDLSKKVSKIEGAEDKELSKTVEKIDDTRETPLSTEVDKIKDNSENKLSSDVEKIHDTREQSLSTDVEKINDSRDNKLSEVVDKISDERVQTLSSLVEKIGEGSKNLELSRNTERLIDSSSLVNSSTALSKNLEKILGGKNKKNISLSKEVSKVNKNVHKETVLSDEVSRIGAKETDLQLGKEVSKIKNDAEYPLSEKISKIEGIHDQSELSKTVEEISNNKEAQLTKDVSRLSINAEQNKLSTKVSKVEKVNKDQNLSSKVSKIEGNKKSQKLSNKVSKIEGKKVSTNLSDEVSKIEGNKKNLELSKKVSNVSDNNTNPVLSKKVSTIEGSNKTLELSSDVSKVGVVENDPVLSKKVSKIEKADHEYPLSKKVSKLDNINKSPSLSEKVSKIDDDRDYPLSEIVDKISDKRDNQLSTKINKIEDNREELELSKIVGKVGSDKSTDQHAQFNPDADNLYDSVLAVNDNQGGSAEELSNYVGKVEHTKDLSELSNKKSELTVIDDDELELSRKVSTIEDNTKLTLSNNVSKPSVKDEFDLDTFVNKIRDYKDLNKYYQNLLHYLQNKTTNKGWAAKISSLMSTYLGGSELSQKRIEAFETALYKEAMMDSPTIRLRAKMPKSDAANASKYLRLKVETILGRGWGKGLGQKARAVLLDEVLAIEVISRDNSEKRAKANRDRLPGKPSFAVDAIRGGASEGVRGALKRVKDKATGLIHGESVETKYPINRPLTRQEQFEAGIDVGWDYQSWTKANSKGETLKGMSIKKVVSKLVDAAMGDVDSSPNNYEFNGNYIGHGAFQGMNTTLEDLCNVSNANSIKTVQDLFDAFERSPYITTAGKVVGGKNNPLNIMTLDTNSFWEIIFEPFVSLSDNGGKSFLPPIEEINLWNKLDHGVMTAYNRWLPITSFEMQKSKLTTKTAGLYDGEISFPTSIEFSNEFRLTFADDQFKSFRTYFERCMEVSVFNSEPHDFTDYGQDGFNNYVGYIKPYDKITSVDKKYTCIAPYKNVTFKCTVYCMTPQKSTINKYELLLTLKDFIEERMGDIDSGGNDLTVAFSIVGENPGHGNSITLDPRKMTSVVQNVGKANMLSRPVKIDPKKVKIIG